MSVVLPNPSPINSHDEKTVPGILTVRLRESVLPPLPLFWDMTSHPRADEHYTNITKTAPAVSSRGPCFTAITTATAPIGAKARAKSSLAPPTQSEIGRVGTAVQNANLQRNIDAAAGGVSREWPCCPSRRLGGAGGRCYGLWQISTEAVGRVRVRLEHARQQRSPRKAPGGHDG